MWDQLILQDTFNKKKEDEEYLKYQTQLKLKMREFYLQQIEERKQ